MVINTRMLQAVKVLLPSRGLSGTNFQARLFIPAIHGKKVFYYLPGSTFTALK
jgi:hypothetical protein